MSQTKNIDIKDFNYFLPDEKIAKYPLEKRDTSKLIVCKNYEITDDIFLNIGSYIPQNSLLFRNNTRVIHARLIFYKQTGAKIEIFCLSPAEPSEYQLSFSQTRSCTWSCMVGNLKKWKDEKLLLKVKVDTDIVSLQAEKIGTELDKIQVKFSWDHEISFGKLLDHIGYIPIPPYLNRESEQIDNERYQTIYSHFDGSVAAPTAGLHFTPSVFEKLTKKNIIPLDITLHVGAGTFQPVKAVNAMEHRMHKEAFSINKSIIKNLAENHNPVVATGTTTLRTLESLYWLAVKSISTNKIQNKLEQWENEQLPHEISYQKAFSDLYELMNKEETENLLAETGIMIVPGYKFKVVDGLITNFHQPQSTLLLLVAAFIGDAWKSIYEHAIKNQYRFLSYGDSSILWR